MQGQHDTDVRGWYELSPRNAFVTLLSLKAKVEELEERRAEAGGEAMSDSLLSSKRQREKALTELATQLYHEGTLSEEDAQNNDLMRFVDES